ncbi:MAG: hypothetical protein NPIRA05_14540 [Nitrospirales bacterium]|nr:MAG: hypothetical protein NPIRA05_14540 [Nitrospirales bacterium]
MSTFINLLVSKEKEADLIEAIGLLAIGKKNNSIFERDESYFSATDDCAVLYSIPTKLYQYAVKKNTLASLEVQVKQGVGASTKFHRLWWEIPRAALESNDGLSWPFMAHGTPYAPFYKSSYFVFKWGESGAEAKADVLHKYPYLNGNYGMKIQSEDIFFKGGLCYGKRTTNFSTQVMPEKHIFSQEGTAIYTADSKVDNWELLGLLNSRVVSYWLSKVCAQHKVYNYVKSLPVPSKLNKKLGALSREGWQISRKLDGVNEVGNAFLLPEVIQVRLGDFDRSLLERRLSDIKNEVDLISFGLYELNDEERKVVRNSDTNKSLEVTLDNDSDSERGYISRNPSSILFSLLSWCVGVAFGRFDVRLAIGQREIPCDPHPFDPLPVQSPGMLPDDVKPFHIHTGILVDDPGNPHDLSRLVEEVLARVDERVTDELRLWLQRDFFEFHLKQYSKGRRKAPIYWPLGTVSGSYTLWLYYPILSDQTLYVAVNDFVEPKLKSVSQNKQHLKGKAIRSKADERELEELQEFELELTNLRENLLQIASDYKPNLDDGVQVTAAPLWQSFRHKSWQKVLKETWDKLENGDYDWSHLAMNYWPKRIREKCKIDKSLAIAHGLEQLYEGPAE